MGTFLNALCLLSQFESPASPQVRYSWATFTVANAEVRLQWHKLKWWSCNSNPGVRPGPTVYSLNRHQVLSLLLLNLLNPCILFHRHTTNGVRLLSRVHLNYCESFLTALSPSCGFRFIYPYLLSEQSFKMTLVNV